jgi:hypothetical protein
MSYDRAGGCISPPEAATARSLNLTARIVAALFSRSDCLAPCLVSRSMVQA